MSKMIDSFESRAVFSQFSLLDGTTFGSMRNIDGMV